MRIVTARHGFGLPELLVVVVVIALLAVLAASHYRESQARSTLSQSRAELRSIATALEAYATDQMAYPIMADLGSGPLTTDPGYHSRTPSHLTTPVAYLSMLPEDPFGIPTNFSSAMYPSSTGVGMRFVYLNYELFLEEFPTSPSFQTRASIAGSWLIYSVGPDGDPFNRDPTTGASNSVYLNYDPTNGAVSAGNVISTQKNREKYGG